MAPARAGPLDKERGRICRKAADYMLPTETVTSRGATTLDAPAAPLASTAAAEPTRLIVDTNTVLDWLVFADAAGCAVGDAIAGGSLRWLATPRMLAELRSVLASPLPERWESARELALTIDVMQWVKLCAEPKPERRLVCRDPADQMFIELACEHSPSRLLTRDRALLALRRRAAALGVQIETASVWLARRQTPR
ncbi:MAG: PIN domain-containing protein [Ideonella sp.]|nr:PIN domain-containing protein [Ideonella sp.]